MMVAHPFEGRLGAALLTCALLWALLGSVTAVAQDGRGDYSDLDVERSGQMSSSTQTRKSVPSVAAVARRTRTTFEFFALPYKVFADGSLGTGLNVEMAVPHLSGIRFGLQGHRSLSQNDRYYLTDWYIGAYSKFFFHSPLYHYGISPFVTAGLGLYRVIGEAIDPARRADQTLDSTSLALSGGVQYQYNKRLAGYGEYQVHTGDGSINSVQAGLSVWLF